MPIPADFSAERNISARERAYNYISEWIIDGTLEAGEKLYDDEIAKKIGISRTPVREALQKLAFQGLVSMKPGVSTTVSRIRPEDIDKLLPPLAALQALATEEAAARITAEDISELENINKKFRMALEGEDYYEALKEDEKFHSMIVTICDNSFIESTVSMLQAHVRRFFFAKAISLSPLSCEEHEMILQLLKEGKKEEAGAVARKNWLRPVDEYNKNRK